jgi:adenosylmethionine-8-amino-7-oxononanoate aminotransferase
MGAAIAKQEVFEKFKPGAKQAFQHVVTFGGHPVACAAAMANLDIIERENIVQNAAEMGKYLLDGLRSLHRHPSVGDTRGLGLLCAVQLVKDKKTRAGFTPVERKELSRSLAKAFKAEKILMNVGDKITIVPPLIIGKPELDRVLTALDKALTTLESEQPFWN